MKQFITLLFIVTLLASCSTRRKVENALNTGNYNRAISKAIKQLRNNKEAKRKQATIVMLSDAYQKANSRDLNTIASQKASKNPEYYKQIYETYFALNQRQEAIKPLLPLRVNNTEVVFDMKNYTLDIQEALNNLSSFFYNNAEDLMQSSDKLTIRNAYELLDYIENENPNYKNTRVLLENAHRLGTSHVLVSIQNKTAQVIPRRLENALLDFETYGLNQFWTQFHASPKTQKKFDFFLQLELLQISISPEQVKEREITRERDIIDGWQYQLDENGNVVKDSLGNDIKVDKYVNVIAQMIEVNQLKSAQIIAQVVIKDATSKQIIDQFPIKSGFVFQNTYATFNGDERALNDNDIVLVGGVPLPFPHNEQLIFDTAEDLKHQLKQIIAKVHF